MEMTRPHLQKGKSDSDGNTWMASAGKTGKRQPEGDMGAYNEARGW